MRYLTCLLISATTAATLAGCATPQKPLTYDEQRIQAKGHTIDELCLVTIIRPEYKKAAEDELTERKAICDWQKVQLLMQARQMQAQQKAADDQQLVNTLLMLRAIQPQPQYVAPVPINTTCSRLGNFVNCQTQ